MGGWLNADGEPVAETDSGAEVDEPCDNEWCVRNEPEHTKGEHIDPPHLDPGHSDFQSAERSINEALGDHPDAWLMRARTELADEE